MRREWKHTMPCRLCGGDYAFLNFCFFFFKKKENTQIYYKQLEDLFWKLSLSQVVFQSTINQQQFYVDLSAWSGNGIYFVHIIDAQGNTVELRKIVLQ